MKRVRRRIALLMRHRPLVLPLLLATVCLDLALSLSDVTRTLGWDRLTVLWTAILPQLGLLAFWTAASDRYWYLRLGGSAVLIVAASTLFIEATPNHTGTEAATVMAAFYGVVLFAGVVRRFVRTAWTRQARRPPDAPRFSMGQLMAVMTIVAVLAAGASVAVWPLNARELAIFFVFVAVPVLSRMAFDASPAAWFAFVLTVGFGFLTALLPADLGDFRGAPLIAQFAFSGVWLWAIDVQPHARRRMAARRHRRAPRVTIVPAGSAQVPDEVQQSQAFDTRA